MQQLAPLASFVEEGFLGAFRNILPKRLDVECKDIELWVFMQQVERLRQWSGACSYMRQICCVESRATARACDWRVLGTKHLLSLMNRFLSNVKDRKSRGGHNQVAKGGTAQCGS